MVKVAALWLFLIAGRRLALPCPASSPWPGYLPDRRANCFALFKPSFWRFDFLKLMIHQGTPQHPPGQFGQMEHQL